MTVPIGAAALWLLAVLPATVGGVLCLAGPRGERAAVPVSLATAAAGVVLAGIVAVGRPAVSAPFVAGTRFGLAVDALSALVVPAVAMVTLLVLVFAAGDVRSSRARFHGLMLLFAAAVAVTATAATLPALLLGWEIMGATSYALIGFHWRDGFRVSAGLTAFLTTRAADLGLYAAAAAALAGGHGLALATLPDAAGGWRHVAAAGVLAAALGKAAQLPFSFWLSQAMQGPSPVSALLHSAAMVAMGGYLLLRTAPLLAASGWAATTAAWVGAATALLLGAVAVAQRDLKQLLAASTAAQLGFVVLAAGLSAVAGGAAHLVAHAATKALLFLAAGAWLTALGTKQLAALRGAARRWPVVGVCAAVGALALAGVAPCRCGRRRTRSSRRPGSTPPPCTSWGWPRPRCRRRTPGRCWSSCGGTDRGDRGGLDDERRGTRHVGAPGAGPAGRPRRRRGAARRARAAAGRGRAGAHARRGGGADGRPAEMAVSAVLALVVLAVVWRWRLPEPGWAVHWLGLEAGTQAVVVRPVLHLAEALARFDDRVLDRAVTAVARGGLAVGRAAARADVGGVDAAVEALARGVRRLGALARRPQTGLLHQYYLQAATLLVAAVVLLLVVR